MVYLLNKSVIEGPEVSKRGRQELQINLLPLVHKLCNYDCVYCKHGWSEKTTENGSDFPDVEELIDSLETKLRSLSNENTKIDSIILQGKGEPTLHPDFDEALSAIRVLKDHYCPKTKLAVLTNGTSLNDKRIASCIKKVDECILKLDAGNEERFSLINRPMTPVKLVDIVETFSGFGDHLKLQSIFFKGSYQGRNVGNLHDKAIRDWIEKVVVIQPGLVFIDTLDWATPASGLVKASLQSLVDIAIEVEQRGVKTSLKDYY